MTELVVVSIIVLLVCLGHSLTLDVLSRYRVITFCVFSLFVLWLVFLDFTAGEISPIRILTLILCFLLIAQRTRIIFDFARELKQRFFNWRRSGQ